MSGPPVSLKHLPKELFLRFWGMGKNYPHKFLKLFSQSVRSCAIIHVGFLSVVFVTPYYTGFTERKPLPFLKSACFTAVAQKRGILDAMAHKLIFVACEFRRFWQNLTKHSNQDETAKQSITANNRTIWRLSHATSCLSMKNGESPGHRDIGHRSKRHGLRP